MLNPRAPVRASVLLDLRVAVLKPSFQLRGMKSKGKKVLTTADCLRKMFAIVKSKPTKNI